MQQEMPWYQEPTRGQWASLSAALTGWVLDAFDFTVYLMAMPYIASEFGVSNIATAGSITLTLLLRLLGGVFAGSLADKVGRKLPLMISVIWFAVCDGAISFAPSFGWILFLRTLFGLGMGAEWTSGATLAMENWPARSRGIASGILQAGWPIGYILAAIAFWVVMPIWGWRALFVLAVLPALVVLPIRMWVPESPEWQKQKKLAPPAPWKELLTPVLFKNLVWASLVLALGFGAYYGMNGMYSTLLRDEFKLAPAEISRMVIIFNSAMLIGSIACGTLAAKKGVVIAVMVPALVMVPLLPLFVGMVGPLELGAVLAGGIGVAYCGVTPMLLADLFPSRVRARATGVVYHVGAACAAFVPPAIAAMPKLTDLSLSMSIVVLVGACQLLLAVSVALKPRAHAAEEELVGQPQAIAGAGH